MRNYAAWAVLLTGLTVLKALYVAFSCIHMGAYFRVIGTSLATKTSENQLTSYTVYYARQVIGAEVREGHIYIYIHVVFNMLTRHIYHQQSVPCMALDSSMMHTCII